jgi:hypothetical protein
MECQCNQSHQGPKGHRCEKCASSVIAGKWWCLPCLKAVKPQPPRNPLPPMLVVKRRKRWVSTGKPPVSSVGTLWAHDVTSKPSETAKLRRRKPQA